MNDKDNYQSLKLNALAALEKLSNFCHYDETLWHSYGEEEDQQKASTQRRETVDAAFNILKGL